MWQQLGLRSPQDAVATAYKALTDSQSSQFVTAVPTEWLSSSVAGEAAMTTRETLDASGLCSVTASGRTERYVADDPGSPPLRCTSPGASLSRPAWGKLPGSASSSIAERSPRAFFERGAV